MRSERFASPPEKPSESPEIGESGRGAGVEFHSVAEGEKFFFFCAGVQIFYFTRRL